MTLATQPCVPLNFVSDSTLSPLAALSSAAPLRPHETVSSTALARFVVHGLLAALDSYLADDLAPHRFTWELSARIEQLAELDVVPRTMTRLRWLARALALHAGTDQPSIGTESGAPTATLLELRTVLAALSRTG